MNSDELMADPVSTGGSAGNMSTSAADSLQAILDGTTSQNQTHAKTQSQLKANLAAAWNTKKFLDEYEMAKSRLSDQKFNISEPFTCLLYLRYRIFAIDTCKMIADYADPLMPRRPSPKQYPPGITTETEQKLKGLIAQIRAASNGDAA
ncbi:hypothetical protein B0H66DRAFT_31258 [Apodospora peruviana]|uniref:Uncharacterized protein n=1 Tax=Apodospora peruviana TaxID=516989 RepID=A0AAE0MEL1_9PEZI|nr:hypothetical protein B0H66DRAFT_31258 [Apodospora peruviana]